MDIKEMQHQAYMTSASKGFHPNPIMEGVAVGRKCEDMLYMSSRIALIHSEASEALEELRNVPFNLVQFADELADIIIRVGDLATIAGVDLDEATRVKMAYNKTREHRHGGRAL